MDYGQILRMHLLSKDNIDVIVNTVIQKYKISSKAIPKCVNIISNYFNKYLTNANRLPQDDNELLIAINFLNNKCYDDFICYLFEKYPGIDLSRHPSNSHIECANNLPTCNTESNIHKLFTDSHFTKDDTHELIILSESEKNSLTSNTNQSNATNIFTQNKMDDFLSYLTNPHILHMFNVMSNQMNLQQPSTNLIVFDEILSQTQVSELLNANKINLNAQTNTNIPDIVDTPNTTNICASDTPDTLNTTHNNNTLNTKDSAHLDDTGNLDNSQNTMNSNDDTNIDYKNLTKNDLPKANQRIKQLISLKEKYMLAADNDKLFEIENEKNEIIAAVKQLKTKLEAQNAVSNSRLIKKANRVDENDKNIEYLDLEFDPSYDYNDMKNIVITCNIENKITNITLIDYFVPRNNYNITRFNNKVVVHFNKIHRFSIPPGKYDINTLLNYITSQISFIEFTVNDSGIITINNNLNSKFDLWLEDESVFYLLGFNDRNNAYKEKISYTASVKYDLSTNNEVFFSLSGTAMEPLKLDFDMQIVVNKILKKSTLGVNIKQFVLNFKNKNGQYYDFTMPFKMCFKINYLNKN